jgi:hypothetical protein
MNLNGLRDRERTLVQLGGDSFICNVTGTIPTVRVGCSATQFHT